MKFSLNNSMGLEIFPIQINKEIHKDEKLVDLILSSSKQKIQDGDIFVISQKIISKQEGRVVLLSNVIPSELAVGIAGEYHKDPKLVESILSESKRIVRMYNEIIIVETYHGFICANAGVDESNVENGYATLLPIDPDKSALSLQTKLQEKTKKKIAVIISDTFGRAFRMGQTDVAIGIAGIDSILEYKGTKDSFGKILRVTAIAISDEICSAAELVMGKTKNCPVSIVRNYKYQQTNSAINSIIRPQNEDLFR
jgi:coenzyme F420-0:L-glutamate ligase/coenzyme F420-1:gamma-L-glutamate ligase